MTRSRRLAVCLAFWSSVLVPTGVVAQTLIAVNGSAAPTSVTIVAGSTTAVSIAGGPGSPTDWIAFYATGAADGAYLDWRYLNGATVAPSTGLTDATVSFNTPITPGTYEFRAFATNGFTRFATSGIVTVVESPAELLVNGISPPTAASVSAGTIMTIDVNNGPANPGDWVALYAAGAPNGTSLAWKYLNNSTTQPAVGSVTSMLTFQAPSASGSYEFRFFASNGFARLATSTTVVVSTSAAQLVVNGTAPPTAVNVAAGSVAVVTVSEGPGNATDWVAFAVAGAPAGQSVDWRYLNGSTVAPDTGVSSATLTFAMPAIGGAYEFRLFANNSVEQVAVSSLVTVSVPTAQIAVNGFTPPASVTIAPASTLTVQIVGGPGNTADWISLADVSAPASSSITWMYLNGSTSVPTTGLTSATLTIPLPASPGTYEIRFFANNGFNRLATSSTITASSSPALISVRVTSPFPGTTFFQPSVITLAAEASATAGTITSVDFFVDATLVGSASASPYTVSWTSPALGQHVLTAAVVHSTAAPVISPPVQVSIDEADVEAGILGDPIATPPGGSYGPEVTVTLSAAVGATIRFTTDGSAPTDTSGAYAGPISLTADTVIRARAFQSGWYDSGGTRASYHLDLEAPTIYAIPSPLPNSNGWNATSPVTISFVCSDPAGVQVCPSPVTIANEGVTEFVSGNAVDAYGQESTKAVTVKIDSIAPTVSLTMAPENGATVPGSSVNISAAVGDALSGNTVVKCHGELATVNNGSAACVVSLNPGLNSVVLSVTDAAGNTASVGRRVTHETVPTALAISPDSRSLFIGESGTLTATTEFGPTISGVTWTSSDDTIASVAENGAVTGHLAGEATITATRDTLSATAILRVIAGGSTEASTAIRWTVPPMPGLVATRQIYANRVDDAGPDLFDVSTAYEVPTVVRALRYDGTQVWSATVEGTPMFGDMFGGLVVQDHEGTSLTRLGGSEESVPWRYESIGYLDRRPAQADDGTIYQIEYTESVDAQSYVVGLDGFTGAVKFRVPLPASTRHRARSVCSGIWIPVPPGDAHFCILEPSLTQETDAPRVSSPVIGLDGEAYISFIEIHEDWRQHDYERWTCDFSCSTIGSQPIAHDASGLGTFSRSETVKLLRIAPEGLATVHTLWQTSTAGPDTPERVYSFDATEEISDLAIDEDGAVLIQATDFRRRWVTDSEYRVNGESMCPTQAVHDRYCYHVDDEASTLRIARIDGASVATRTLDTQAAGYSYGQWPLTLVGDEHTAFLQRPSTLEAIDTQTLSTKWTIPSEGCCETLTAMRDGGVAIAGWDNVMRVVDISGSVTSVGPVPAYEATQPAVGFWIGSSLVNGQLMGGFGAPIGEPNYGFRGDGGNSQRRSAPEFVGPFVRVNCRPLGHWLLGFFADHCYVVTRNKQETRYISADPTNPGGPPWGPNVAANRLTMAEDDANALITWPWINTKVKPEVLSCMQPAVNMWNAAALEYAPVGSPLGLHGPNSNTFASWIVHECKAGAKRAPWARAHGWRKFVEFGVPSH